MPYNLTWSNTTSSTLGFFQHVNHDLTNDFLVVGFGVVIFIILFTLGKEVSGDNRKSLMVSSFISLVLNTVMFLGFGFIGWYMPIVYLALFVLSIVFLQPPDYST